MSDTERSSMTRRQALHIAGGAGLAGLVLAACGTDTPSATEATTPTISRTGSRPACVLTPQDQEGPFYTDLDLVRRDITGAKPGSPLDLRLTVVDVESCAPVQDATVDIWQADAIGHYSAFPGQGDGEDVDTTSETFLRGVQSTDADGVVTFTSIYPGWYPGRTTHVHLKVQLGNRTQATTQLYFPDSVTVGVYAEPPYADRGPKDTSNDEEGIGPSSPLLMALESKSQGHLATHTIGIAR